MRDEMSREVNGLEKQYEIITETTVISHDSCLHYKLIAYYVQ